MTTLAAPDLVPLAPARRAGFLAELDGASPVAFVGPNWFATVMGTGIVAVALTGLPFPVPYAGPLAAAIWVLATLLLVVVGTATALHHVGHPAVARGHRNDPVLVHFYGAPPMALMTVGAGALLAGDRVIGSGAALTLAIVLWTTGTVLGLVTTVLVPARAIRRDGLRVGAAYGGWLMPVVPPMVSAATGALLVPHLPGGPAQVALLLTCCVLFAVTLLAAAAVLVLLALRLRRHGWGAAAAMPTWWIVLGPLGQSVTAALHLGTLGPGVLPAPYGTALATLAGLYAVPVWCLAMTWLAVVAVRTVRTAVGPGGLPFGLPWWSFTFPVGTVVTATAGLAARTHAGILGPVAAALFALLVLAWVTALARTSAGVWSGRLLLPPVERSAQSPRKPPMNRR